MTTYGTIPSQANASSRLSLLWRAKELFLLGLRSQRPWLELVQWSAFSLPISFSVAAERIKTNVMIFRTNYIVIFIIAILISMLWHPVHLSVFVILVIAWLYVYSRDNETLLIFGCVVDDSALVLVLLVLTIGIFLLTDVSNGFLMGGFCWFARCSSCFQNLQTQYNIVCYSGKPRLRSAVEMLRTTQENEQQLQKVSLPILILHGEADTVTDPSVSRELYEKAKSSDKKIILYEDAYHSLLEGEPDEMILRVLSDIISWLDEHSLEAEGSLVTATA